MTDTAYFIQDRAETLAYEAVRFPATTETALAWLYRAVGWAKEGGLDDLAARLQDIIAHISS